MPTITSGGLLSSQPRKQKPDFSQLIWSGQQLLEREIDQSLRQLSNQTTTNAMNSNDHRLDTTSSSRTSSSTSLPASTA